jgi:hypothetical protein
MLTNKSLFLKKIKKYLESVGWAPVKSPYSTALVYRSPLNLTGECVEIVLPARAELSDYERRVENSIATIAAVLETTTDSVVSSITSVFSDVIKMSLDDAIIRSGTIPLEVASNFIIGVKNLLASAATTEELRAVRYPRTLKRGIEFAESCRFGHTFKGSFGFTVSCPLARNTRDHLDESFENPPFERMVIERLYNGLSNSMVALKEEDTTLISKNFERGLSLNMVEEIVRLHDVSQNSRISYKFIWSPEWRVRIDEDKKSKIVVDNELVEFLKEAAKGMREERTANTSTITGTVFILKSRIDPSAVDVDYSHERQVTIITAGLEPKAVQVTVNMRKDDYYAAVDAHKSGRTVQITGKIEKVSRKHVMSDYSEFVVLD